MAIEVSDSGMAIVDHLEQLTPTVASRRFVCGKIRPASGGAGL